ncbi:GHKL domain-containing protein [Mucilaginibacter sp. BJC16-A38]|uniref:ATP-binding protein n=1 Tax=Mucilaginibacter phenanthrenivorans TaxID=1234842 RepID=UPI0021576CC8|nr:ATP-binding protein [Mucilaginibacter phenanthrenivorans]MCR8560352.1 GHKL domain-containing protein [Mucilaginibacter phenanthrenivorans]
MIEVTTNWLQSIDELNDVPSGQLLWLIRQSENRVLPQGALMFQAGQPMKGTEIIVKGKVRISLPQNNELREVGILEEKSITGYLPFSRGKVATLNGLVLAETQVLFLPIEKIPEMIGNHFELTQAMVHVMTSRVRNFTALQQQNEKMMAIGKLSAGMSHELNNPSSAIVRSAASLKKHLLSVPKTFEDIINIKISSEQAKEVSKVVTAVLEGNEKPALSMLERSRREDDMAVWMDSHQIDNSPEVAENFVDYGIGRDEAQALSLQIPPAYLSKVLNWININMITEKMVTDIEEASKRIAELVGAVKTFTHMDQGHDKQYADIHIGIRNTLTMLHHKIHKENVMVIEHYDDALPPVKAMIGELNQVWTNLIDNALDALEYTQNPVLEIVTRKDNEFVEVTVIDNGPGIPEGDCSQIFDPFFTTKEIGKGTGLGLDVVSKIVRQHRGSVKVNSVPGRTAFIVCFPING